MGKHVLAAVLALSLIHIFNAGPSSVAAEAQTSATSIAVEDAKVFFVGQKIQNTTDVYKRQRITSPTS